MAGPGGGRTPVEQQYRTPPADTLLDAADLVPQSPGAPGYEAKDAFDSPVGDGVGTTALREFWLNGITYKPEQGGSGTAQFVGCGLSTTKSPEASAAIVSTDPFLIFREVHCSALGWESADYVQRARRALAATEAFLVEQEFFAGAQAQAAILAGKDYPADQWLATTGATVLNSGGLGAPVALSPVAAVAAIHTFLAGCAGGAAAMIHMAPSVLDFVLSEGQTLIYRDGSRYVDAKGNRVVAGYGYSGVGPDGVAAPAGKTWVYTSGPVRYWRTDVVILPDRLDQALDRIHNDVSFRAERYYLVDWDRSCHAAVLVNLADV